MSQHNVQVVITAEHDPELERSISIVVTERYVDTGLQGLVQKSGQGRDFTIVHYGMILHCRAQPPGDQVEVYRVEEHE